MNNFDWLKEFLNSLPMSGHPVDGCIREENGLTVIKFFNLDSNEMVEFSFKDGIIENMAVEEWH